MVDPEMSCSQQPQALYSGMEPSSHLPIRSGMVGFH
jgi:hypothetical protein